MRRLAVTLIAMGLCASVVEGAAPSENKGRAGTYSCKTSNPTYNYYVYVPKSYSDDHPAGLHLFFHGQSSQGTAPYFDLWAKNFLEPFDLIGINMQYMDGDNSKDTAGKVAAAVEAIMQVTADYKIIRGRGVVGSFSGGGLPHGQLVDEYAKQGTKRGLWPFNHSAAYDSNYRRSVKNTLMMSWFFGLGSEEYTLAQLGETQTARAADLYAETVQGRCPDIYLKIIKGKGHSIAEADTADSAKGFRRSDLAFCAFLYEPDFPEGELKPIVKRANDLELGRAASAVKTLLANEKLDAEIRKKAARISETIERRVDAVVELAKELAENDPVLCGYYGGIFTRQLKGHPREDELKKLLAPVAKKERTARGALTVFAQHLKDFLTPGGKPKPESVGVLKQIQTRAGENSLLGKMAGEFLALQ